ISWRAWPGPCSPRMNPIGPQCWSAQLQHDWPADDAWLRPGLEIAFAIPTPSVIFSSRSVLGYPRSMPNSGTKRSRKMVTIHNLHEMKEAAHENDPQTKLLVLGLGEAIVTTCAQARVFLENGSAFGDEPKGTS